MTEREIAVRVLEDLRCSLPGAVVVKHNDVGTKGIPDIQVARFNRTSWGELKKLGKSDTLKSINKVEQLLFCHQLATVNNGRCWVIVYEDLGKGSGVSVWQPRALFAHIWPHLAGPTAEGATWKVVGREPMRLSDTDQPHGLLHILNACGALWVPGRPYNILTRLVLESKD